MKPTIAIALLAILDGLAVLLLWGLWSSGEKRDPKSERMKRTLARSRLARIGAGTMKGMTTIMLVIVIVVLTFTGWYSWDRSKNRGFAFGYYGQFNTVSRAMTTLPGITVIGSGYNPDLSLEEFGFTLEIDQGQTFEIWFSDTDPIRKMTGKRLSAALQERVAQELSNNAAKSAL